MLQVLDAGIADDDAFALGGVVEGRELHGELEFRNEDVGAAGRVHHGVRRLVVEAVVRLELELEGRADLERLRVVVQPDRFLGPKDGERLRRLDRDRVGRLGDAGEGLGKVGALSAVEERRRDLDDRDLVVRRGLLALGVDGRSDVDDAADRDGLASVAVRDRLDAQHSLDDIADLERGRAGADTEAVREVEKVERVAVDGGRKNGASGSSAGG